MSNSEIAAIQAEVDALKVVTVKLFEWLAFREPSNSEKFLQYLERYASEPDPDEKSRKEASSLKAIVAVLRGIHELRASAVVTREVLTRAMEKNPPPPEGD